jgi:hypothetical protein
VDVLDPFRFVVISVAGWMNQRQREAIDYLREENQVVVRQYCVGCHILTLQCVHSDDAVRQVAESE